MPQLLTADAVIPMTSDAEFFAERAGVVVEGGVIVGVGPSAELRRRFGELPEQYTPGVMLPGLVNCHTHLELGYQRERMESPKHFTDWVTALMKNYPTPDQIDAAVRRAVQGGIHESLHAGVTAIGDISRHCDLTRSLLMDAPLRTTSFGEVIGLGKMRDRRHAYLAAAASRKFASDHLTIGLSPHAPYTVEGPTLPEAVERAVADHLPLTMHLGELSDERGFLADATGKLAEWPTMRSILDERVPRHGGGPIEWAREYGLLGKEGAARKVPTVLAHVNYCSELEMGVLAESGASVAYCPRTHAYFGHDRVKGHGYREMMEAGINVALGTDSLASNPDLSVLKEARFVWERDGVLPYRAMQMVTVNGARALGMEGGVIRVGGKADLAVFPVDVGVSLERILGELLGKVPGASGVWVNGVKVV